MVNYPASLSLTFTLFFLSITTSLAQQPQSTSTPAPLLAGPGLEQNQAFLSEYQREIDQMREDLGLSAMPKAGETPSAEQTGAEIDPSKIKIRVITGNEGIPFPSPEQVVLEPSPTPVVVATFTPIPTATPYQRAERCPRSETIKKQHSPNNGDNKILLDKLFLHEDLIPLDSDEVYGAGVSLYPYGPGAGEGQYILQEMYNVPCLPFRMRVTSWGQYEHMGDDALKNYGDQQGRGIPKLHPWVSEKLYGPKIQQKRRR